MVLGLCNQQTFYRVKAMVFPSFRTPASNSESSAGENVSCSEDLGSIPSPTASRRIPSRNYFRVWLRSWKDSSALTNEGYQMTVTSEIYMCVYMCVCIYLCVYIICMCLCVYIYIPWRGAWQPTPVLLPGEILWTEEPGGLQSMGLQRVRHTERLSTYRHTHTHTHTHTNTQDCKFWFWKNFFYSPNFLEYECFTQLARE